MVILCINGDDSPAKFKVDCFEKELNGDDFPFMRYSCYCETCFEAFMQLSPALFDESSEAQEPLPSNEVVIAGNCKGCLEKGAVFQIFFSIYKLTQHPQTKIFWKSFSAQLCQECKETIYEGLKAPVAEPPVSSSSSSTSTSSSDSTTDSDSPEETSNIVKDLISNDIRNALAEVLEDDSMDGMTADAQLPLDPLQAASSGTLPAIIESSEGEDEE